MNWKLRIKRWWKKTVEKVKETAKKIFKWANENKELATAAVAAAISVVKSASRMYVAHCDKVRRERVRVEDRRNRGETYQMIFYDMNCLR